MRPRKIVAGICCINPARRAQSGAAKARRVALAVLAVAALNACAHRPPQRPAAPSPSKDMAWPLRGAVVKRFGPDSSGIEIAGPAGAPVAAAADGVVAFVGRPVDGAGGSLMIRHPGRVLTLYGNLREILVKTGQSVRKDQAVATLAPARGRQSARLAFEIRASGSGALSTPVDPLQRLPAP